MLALTAETRASSLAAMADGVLDVLVIGGGITGAGVALDAAARGLRVGLVEREDIASGTSGRSSRLIHGGARYLRQAEFGLVRESLRERAILLSLAPHLVRPLSFLLPVPRPSQRGSAAVGLGLYGLLAPRPVPPAPVGERGRGGPAGAGSGPPVRRLRVLGLSDRRCPPDTRGDPGRGRVRRSGGHPVRGGGPDRPRAGDRRPPGRPALRGPAGGPVPDHGERHGSLGRPAPPRSLPAPASAQRGGPRRPRPSPDPHPLGPWPSPGDPGCTSAPRTPRTPGPWKSPRSTSPTCRSSRPRPI